MMRKPKFTEKPSCNSPNYNTFASNYNQLKHHGKLESNKSCACRER